MNHKFPSTQKISIGGKKIFKYKLELKIFCFYIHVAWFWKKRQELGVFTGLWVVLFPITAGGNEQAGFPTLRFLICSSNSSWYATEHAFSPLITMTYFLLSVGWSAGYDLILNLLMVPKRKANDRAAVGWQNFKKGGKNVHRRDFYLWGIFKSSWMGTVLWQSSLSCHLRA